LKIAASKANSMQLVTSKRLVCLFFLKAITAHAQCANQSNQSQGSADESQKPLCYGLVSIKDDTCSKSCAKFVADLRKTCEALMMIKEPEFTDKIRPVPATSAALAEWETQHLAGLANGGQPTIWNAWNVIWGAKTTKLVGLYVAGWTLGVSIIAAVLTCMAWTHEAQNFQVKVFVLLIWVFLFIEQFLVLLFRGLWHQHLDNAAKVVTEAIDDACFGSGKYLEKAVYIRDTADSMKAVWVWVMIVGTLQLIGTLASAVMAYVSLNDPYLYSNGVKSEKQKNSSTASAIKFIGLLGSEMWTFLSGVLILVADIYDLLENLTPAEENFYKIGRGLLGSKFRENGQVVAVNSQSLSYYLFSPQDQYKEMYCDNQTLEFWHTWGVVCIVLGLFIPLGCVCVGFKNKYSQKFSLCW